MLTTGPPWVVEGLQPGAGCGRDWSNSDNQAWYLILEFECPRPAGVDGDGPPMLHPGGQAGLPDPIMVIAERGLDDLLRDGRSQLVLPCLFPLFPGKL